MHVFIDARGLENRIDGIGQYALHILTRLPHYKNARFSVLLRDDLHYELPVEKHISYIRTTIRRFSMNEGTHLSSLVSSVSPDLYFNLSSYIFKSIPCKHYMMLYDLLSTHFKGHFKGMGPVKGFLARQYFRYRIKKSVLSADGIFTISNYSREKICSHYRLDRNLVNVVYGGVDAQFGFFNNDTVKQEFIRKHDLPNKYFLHVGNLKPYKNITNIIKAYNCFLQKHPDSPIGLVFTGNRGRGYNDTLRLITRLNLGNKARIIGYLDGNEIPLLYGASIGLFFPSLEEGLGLPVLEAMCCKTPVVTSQGTATEEIAGGHAFLVNPRLHDSLMDGLEFLAFSEKDPEKLDKAYAYAIRFTWDKTVDAIIPALIKTESPSVA
jgi:glycosyltransferase involved in cell wall biosynthesis